MLYCAVRIGWRFGALQVYVLSVADGGRFWSVCERGGTECLGASLLLVYY